MPEVLDRVNARDLSEWLAFERVFGPLTVQERVDAAGAVGAWATAASTGSKAGPEAFLPAWDRPVSRPRQTAEQMMDFMRGLMRRGKGRRRGN